MIRKIGSNSIRRTPKRWRSWISCSWQGSTVRHGIHLHHHLLDRAEAEACCVNKPASLRDCNEKTLHGWFPDCCAPTLVTRSHAQLRNSSSTRDIS